LNKGIYIQGGVWIAMTVLSLGWSLTEAFQQRDVYAIQTSKSFFEVIHMTREWNAAHGGVYVPVTDSTQPNPWLEPSNRDIVTDQGMALTRMTPSHMTRQIGEIVLQRNSILFHLTSLNPIRPDNAPTPIEKNALESFEKGADEYTAYLSGDQGTGFFYMAPLFTEKSCLRCHSVQGYREGEIRGGLSITLKNVPKTGIHILIMTHIALGGLGLAGIVLLRIKLRRAYGMVEKQARQDALTSIPNRLCHTETYLKEYNRAVREGLPLSVIICDIDNFKRYNDTFGHTGGDACLVRVARVITESLKRPGDFCARYGGEEFVVILPGTVMKGARRVAETIRTSVEALQIPNPESLPWKVVTMSLGIATANPGSAMSSEELIRRADAALYNAKSKGRNTVCEADNPNPKEDTVLGN
jgi:diguanylate cyclase (GGDEF)-like protein